jgi:DNA gyrase subunit A
LSIEPTSQIRPVQIEQEMRTSYLDYAMSVIVSRALPDVRDGLKPVQRRILWAMYESGARAGTAYRKSAATVGEVMAKYHPHGDQAVYDTLVRMAQVFSLRYPLVDGQGNFGSVDGDPPAAMRYTEARMSAIAEELLADIDQDTVDFEPNYDGRHQQPSILPSRIPNLLLNGSSGIAVGMATSIPPHNLGEIAEAITMLLENPETTTLDDLLGIIRGPDFPTYGIALVGREKAQLRTAYGEGHGRVTMHARTHIEESSRGRTSIIVTELPYQVNKALLIEKIADLVRDRKIEGIADLRDESDRNGMRIVIELKKEGSIQQVKNLLFKHTAMRSTFAINMMAIVDGAPRRLGLKHALELFIEHRRVVIRRRTEHQLEKAREREHILQGLLRAIDMIDAVIATIRAAESAQAALDLLQGEGLVQLERLPANSPAGIRSLAQRNPFGFTEAQARAILDMQLRRLAALERQAILSEYEELIKTIAALEDLLANPRKMDFLIRDDMEELKKKYGDARRTEIVEADPEDFREEDLIPHQDCVVTLSIRNYIKRMPLEEFRRQRRGGQGARGAPTREEDAVMKLVVCDSHDNLLFFTDRGKVYHLRAFDVPDTKKQAKGLPIVNLIDVEPGERVTTILPVRSYDRDFILLATRNGEIKKTLLKEFEEVRRNGKIAMDLDVGDQLIAARMATNETNVILVSSEGQAIRFGIGDLRQASRTSGGVRGMRLATGGYVVGVETTDDGSDLLIISERGFGKRTAIAEYPVQGRGGQGVKTLNITDRTGKVAACRVVVPGQELMLVTREGIVVRTRVDQISRIGRNTQGVTVMRVAEGDAVASIAVFTMQDDAGGRRTRALEASANGAEDDAALNETLPRDLEVDDAADDTDAVDRDE